MAKLIRDEEHIMWVVDLAIDAEFEGDIGTYHTFMEDAEHAFYEISEQLDGKRSLCAECGEEIFKVRNRETGDWYEICDRCGRCVYGDAEGVLETFYKDV
jgi:hypothetical protein